MALRPGDFKSPASTISPSGPTPAWCRKRARGESATPSAVPMRWTSAHGAPLAAIATIDNSGMPAHTTPSPCMRGRSGRAAKWAADAPTPAQCSQFGPHCCLKSRMVHATDSLPRLRGRAGVGAGAAGTPPSRPSPASGGRSCIPAFRNLRDVRFGIFGTRNGDERALFAQVENIAPQPSPHAEEGVAPSDCRACAHPSMSLTVRLESLAGRRPRNARRPHNARTRHPSPACGERSG